MGEKLPLFFRLMIAIPGFQTKLSLPPIISRKLVEQDVEQVLLTSQKGSWKVETHISEEKLCFTKGWDEFVLQHSICDVDLLLFKHTGGSSFKVKVLGNTCCVRDFQRGRTHMKNAKEDNKASVKLEEDIDEVPSPVEIQKHDHARYKEVTKRKQKPRVVNMSSTDRLQFVTRIKQYNVRRRSPYMHIPAYFCIANDLYCNARICLKGPSSEQEVSLKVCRGGRTIYAVITRGWSEFIAGNDLKVGEILTFNLRSTEGSSNGIVFDVEALRRST